MPKININMQWLVSVVTGIWAIWTWAANAGRDRKKEHARVTALYVQPLLSASEDLQSRIYRILEPEGLRILLVGWTTALLFMVVQRSWKTAGHDHTGK
jgi:hypothetical protein